jgi:SAM-dependent methyltransferase
LTDLRCPDCRLVLTLAEDRLECPQCASFFSVEEGIADFCRGAYYDSFPGASCLSCEDCQGLANEFAGTASRVVDFYLPAAMARRQDGRPLRLLDSGCGNGISVDLLGEAGIEAWGNDVSALRKWQWRERKFRHRLVVADTRRLPFADGSFDLVISSGVLEHVGVEEGRDPHYFVRPRADRDAQRLDFLRELLRVLAPGGQLYLDFPNGAFPIDFWHGDRPGGARFHPLNEGFLPKTGEIRRYLEHFGAFEVEPLSPLHRLRMKQVGAHWYGRLFGLPMKTLLRLMELPGLRFTAGWGLNPYLVLKISHQASAQGAFS